MNSSYTVEVSEKSSQGIKKLYRKSYGRSEFNVKLAIRTPEAEFLNEQVLMLGDVVNVSFTIY